MITKISFEKEAISDAAKKFNLPEIPDYMELDQEAQLAIKGGASSSTTSASFIIIEDMVI